MEKKAVNPRSSSNPPKGGTDVDGFLNYTDGGAPRVAWCDGTARTLHPIPGIRGTAELLRLPLAEARERAARAAVAPPRARLEEVCPLPPVDGGTEVWAAGVTYERSRKARGEESGHGDIYDRVYDAERPELFFKAPAWRVVTEGEPVAFREDSELNVPEPELALVATAHGEILGYCVCDDVSSRSIEGDNALYLPQAKMYAGSCALSPLIRPVWLVPDVRASEISLRVWRDEAEAFAGTVSLTAMRRDPADLLSHLFKGLPFPDGVVLATGTGIVPGLDFTLAEGDVIDIRIGGIGALRTPVVRGTTGHEWLVRARTDPSARPGASVLSGG